jgi:hypothetical protein
MTNKIVHQAGVTHVKTNHMWEVFPYMGALPIHGKSSKIWEHFPNYGNTFRLLPQYEYE